MAEKESADRQGRAASLSAAARKLSGRLSAAMRKLAAGGRASQTAAGRAIAHYHRAAHDKIVPIVFCADGAYGAYCAVAVQSLLAHAAPDRLYHIILFDCGLKPEDIEALKRQIAAHKNARLKIEPLAAYLQANREAFNVGEEQHLSPATYGRLLIPVLCGRYDKVIYADIDMIFNRDSADLLRLDLGENYLAGAVDSNIEAERKTRPSIKKYTAETLGLAAEQAYVNAGLLVFNISAWRRDKLTERCLATLAEKHFKRHDQDALNFICKGKIYALDACWNRYCKLAGGDKDSGAEQGEEAAVLHFVGALKPWHSLIAEKGVIWWKYARQTVFYNRFLAEALGNKAGLNIEVGRVSYRFCGLPFAAKYIYPKKIKYFLFGLPIARLETKPKTGEKSFRLLGLKLFSRRKL